MQDATTILDESKIIESKAYRKAYEAAVPNPQRFMEFAKEELLTERFPQYSFYTLVETEEVLSDVHLIFERAVHISKHRQAIEAVAGPQRAAAAAAATRLADTCPVCQELNPPICQRWIPLMNDTSAPIMSCKACAEIAQVLLIEGTRTKQREQRVRAALGKLSIV